MSSNAQQPVAKLEQTRMGVGSYGTYKFFSYRYVSGNMFGSAIRFGSGQTIKNFKYLTKIRS